MINFNEFPNQPGIYKFINKKGQIIYIGKAIDIKKRVMQYFKTGSHKNEYFKSLIFNVEYVLTKSESQALLLEINLIKTYKPKFNIIFKDDKTYPFICVVEKDGDVQVDARRSKQARGPNCFGPFPAGTKPFATTKTIQELYKLKRCKKNQSRCIYNQLGQCLHLDGEARLKYNKQAKKDIISFFKGKDNALKDFVISKIENFSKIEEFEMAQKYKEFYERLDLFHEKQSIYSQQIENADYIGSAFSNQSLAIFMIHVRQGRIVNTFSKKYDVVGDFEESFKNFFISFYQSFPAPDFIYTNNYIDEEMNDVFETQIKSPKIGQKKQLVEMANTNANELINSVIASQNKKDEFEQGWFQLAKFVGIKDLINIELYDASHIAGKNYVGAKIEYEYGKYNSVKTRKYDLSQLTKSDDSLALAIMIEKRFKNNKEVPDLIIVDGAKAQINSVAASLHRSNIKTQVMGLVKNDKHQTNEIMLQDGTRTNIKDVEFKKLLNKMQEKVHNVAVRYHRSKRARDLIKK